jgi:methionyl aminopeptidase
MISLKSLFEIEKIEVACKIVAEVLLRCRDQVQEGLASKDLDRMIKEWIIKESAYPAFLGYRGFPASSCISYNEEVVHGIPGPRRMKKGDIIKIDVGVVKNGFFGDAAITVPIEPISEEKRRLMESTLKSLHAGIQAAKKGNRISDISHAVQTIVEQDGFSPVQALVGHGVGKAVHEDPQVPNFGEPGCGAKIRDGLVLAIEPMVNAGTYEVYTDTDGWTVVTDDGKPSAHFEHTIAIINGLPKILTGK